MAKEMMVGTWTLRGLLWAAMLFWGTAAAPAQPVLFVDWQANGQNNGASWEDAYTDLQLAIEHAVRAPGEVTEIWVAAGIYRPAEPDGDRDAAFDLVEGVGIYGGFAGTENSRHERNPDLHVTTLSGDLNGDDNGGNSNRENSYHVVYGDWVDASAVLDGFTIKAGNANGASRGRNRGGGFYNFVGSPTLADCKFVGNNAFAGGAVYNMAGNVTLTRCIISLNHATSGGGIFNEVGSPSLAGCEFEENTATSGGGMINDQGNPTLAGCRFTGNVAQTGGGVDNHAGDPILTDCTFTRNRALGNAGGTGGALCIDDGAPALTRCSFIENQSLGSSFPGAGGAIYNKSTDDHPTVRECTFLRNSAAQGGGLHNSGRGLILEGCTFRANEGDDGAAVFNVNAVETVLVDCLFEQNVAGAAGGAIYHAGGSDDRVTRCIFDQNSAQAGGAVNNSGANGLVISYCTFTGNTATGPAGAVRNEDNGPAIVNCGFFGNTAQFGGAMYNLNGADAEITNCVFSGNRADGKGGAVRSYLAGPVITHCTFSRNAALDTGGGIDTSQVKATVANCIFWYNVDRSGFGPTSQINGETDVDYTCIQTGWPSGQGNIEDDPMFADPNGPDNIIGTPDDDVRLTLDSPCIDAADNEAVPPDVADLDGDGDMDEPTPMDYDDYPRFYEIPGVPDTGNGEKPIVDMGAHEFYDCNENGVPDGEDIKNGTSEDCNENRIPDECELEGNDCNNNLIPDDCDIKEGRSKDCNENLVPDECDIENGTSKDCNNNHIPDECDIREGRSEDCNENGVPDECDIEQGTSEDCNENLIPDECEVPPIGPPENDCNENGIPDECEVPPIGPPENDCNNNGIPDECDIDEGRSEDCNENRIPDECEVPPIGPPENDCNENHIPDDCDIMEGTSRDCNGNWVPDECDVAEGTSEDCNNNGIPDECEVVQLYVGTRAMEPGKAKVCGYLRNGDWIDMTSSGLGDSSVVMDLEFYQSQLYAGVLSFPPGRGEWEGQVWRWERDTWVQVGTLEKGVTVLAVMNGHLYAATAPPALYRCVECDGSDWEQLSCAVKEHYFRSGIATDICGRHELYLGDGQKDIISVYVEGGTVREINNFGGSCIWDFALYDGDIYAGAFGGGGDHWGHVYRMRGDDCGARFDRAFVTEVANNWALEPFRGYLYIGSGAEEPGDAGGKLWTSTGNSPIVIKTWPTTWENEGVSALTAAGDEYLYIGLGSTYPAGAGDGTAEVWRYDGESFVRISDKDAFGAAVQTLVLSPSEVDCNRNGRPDDCDIDQGHSQDVNGNRVPDECETPPCKDVRKLKGKCKRFTLKFKIKVRGDANNGKSVTVRVNDDWYELPVNEGKASLILRKRRGEQRIILLRPPDCVAPKEVRCK